MIRLRIWIVIICIFVTVFTSPPPDDTESKSISDEIFMNVSMIETIENFTTTEIPITSETQNPNSSHVNNNLVPDKTEALADSENASIVYETSIADKPVPMSLTTKIKDTPYMNDMTITYETSTSSMKKPLTDEVQIEISTLPNSYKNLYYVAKTTTEYGLSREMSAESPDIASIDDMEKSTLSIGLTSENVHDIDLNDFSSTTQASESEDIVTVKFDDENDAYSVSAKILREMFGDTNFTSIESILTKDDHPKSDSLYENLSKNNSSFINFSEGVPTKTPSSDTQDKNKEFSLRATDDASRMEEPRKNQKTSFDIMHNEERVENLKGVLIGYEKPTTDLEARFDLNRYLILNENLTTRDYNTDNVSVDATETNFNSTRNPKRIQGEERYPEGRIRPIHPDPGYANRPELDIVRPYRPDVPLHQYPYYRPTPDYRTPVIREDKEFTRPPRPDPEYPRVSFRPNFSYSKTSQTSNSSKSTSSYESITPKPYRPSFNRPYQPQSSFGRPYRPDYLKPASKPSEYHHVTQKPTIDIKGSSNQDSDNSEHSRADYEYTRFSDALPTYTKHYQSDVRLPHLKPETSKTYRPTYDSDISIHSKSTSSGDSYDTKETSKVSRPDMESNRPSSYYPRPGFGNNYQASETPIKPFSVGTVTSAKNLTRVEFIKADCFDNHMKVTVRFNGTFSGLVYSSGYAQDSACSYVNGSGRNHYEFFIRLNRCGTLGQQEVTEQRLRSASRRRQERAQYLVNTVTVQYNPVIEEDIDEHFRVTCEYGYDFWKTVTFPIVNVESSAVKVRTGSPVVFTLPPPQCNMEIRSGFGPSGTRVSGPVNVGDHLTLVIHMKSESTGFDILVSNCYAHNGAQKRLQLIDSNGCVVQEKLVSPFRGVSSPDRSQQVTLYSYLKAFRFTGSPALYIECDVHMCHGTCPPQRCYWRHLYKRSAEEVSTEETTTADNVMSESISLFQALEVRHEETDAPSSLSVFNSSGSDMDDVVCLRIGGFAALLACLLLLLFLTTFTAVCMCLRMKKMKRLVESPDTKHFVEFDGHVPFK